MRKALILLFVFGFQQIVTTQSPKGILNKLKSEDFQVKVVKINMQELYQAMGYLDTTFKSNILSADILSPVKDFSVAILSEIENFYTSTAVHENLPVVSLVFLLLKDLFEATLVEKDNIENIFRELKDQLHEIEKAIEITKNFKDKVHGGIQGFKAIAQNINNMINSQLDEFLEDFSVYCGKPKVKELIKQVPSRESKEKLILSALSLITTNGSAYAEKYAMEEQEQREKARIFATGTIPALEQFENVLQRFDNAVSSQIEMLNMLANDLSELNIEQVDNRRSNNVRLALQHSNVYLKSVYPYTFHNYE
ncbi:hypothetical protein O9G_000860 [Rozella allomycis CSF55]|uniref:Uncharacterized protein n=1 Tax=Rozella allomycis (strain CSF55) TaxID=988480 RepID=A0A075ARH9_ROZAC|nr:hypothetical protein O9G_000860 [Rozella allomycis CSF55]|eukprot:EPZ32785.1 hypothetical protein O9G_000860 [Rozella allomycis CSF55]